MAGYWPSSFLRVYGLRLSRGPQNRKKRTRPISTHLDQANLVNKGFNFACRIQWVVPSRQDGSILPTWVANHSARFGSSCPLTELAI